MWDKIRSAIPHVADSVRNDAFRLVAAESIGSVETLRAKGALRRTTQAWKDAGIKAGLETEHIKASAT